MCSSNGRRTSIAVPATEARKRPIKVHRVAEIDPTRTSAAHEGAAERAGSENLVRHAVAAAGGDGVGSVAPMRLGRNNLKALVSVLQKLVRSPSLGLRWWTEKPILTCPLRCPPDP
jgi:hypothetical protein